MANSGNKAESKIAAFWDGVKKEYRKIIWPTKETAAKQLAAVMTVSVITGLLIALVDLGSQKLIDFLLNLSL
ncbi:MAG: preprotein translocase subunit SecE [Lachnospiraceae bacterium]|jgi:preprotein translocase subunit SecE|nr:preprotein translocase subunit SecE [Lachnospiraceae bacterium]